MCSSLLYAPNTFFFFFCSYLFKSGSWALVFLYLVVHACMHACVLSRVQLFVILWTVACQATLSLEFSKQEYWTGWQFPPPNDLPDLGIELMSPLSPWVDSLPLHNLGRHFLSMICPNCTCMKVFLVSHSFFSLGCSRRDFTQCKHCSKVSQIPGPSLPYHQRYFMKH